MRLLVCWTHFHKIKGTDVIQAFLLKEIDTSLSDFPILMGANRRALIGTQSVAGLYLHSCMFNLLIEK